MDNKLGAYGGNLAGAEFDPKAFFRKPQVMCRMLSVAFAVVVLSCIKSQGGYFGKCVFSNDWNACNYGTVISGIAMVAAVGLIVLDAMFDNISNSQHRKYAVSADILFSGLWSFLWFVGFCYLTNRWQNTPAGNQGSDGARAAIAFSFFSIISWGLQTYFAIDRYRQGVGGLFASADDVIGTQYPGSTVPGGGGFDAGGMGADGGYQQPPMAQAPRPHDDVLGGDLSAGGYQQTGGQTQQPYQSPY